MVVKHKAKGENARYQFENGVILYGSQARHFLVQPNGRFENGVILYGSQADEANESDVL